MARWSALIRHVHLPVLLLITCCIHESWTSPGPCEVETGQASIIVDIEESRGDQVNQSTVPAELPVVGQPDVDVLLSTVFPKGPTLFQLDGKRLQLLQPLDRDADNLSHMVFQLICQVKATKKRRTIPVIVRVSDINDNAPVFHNTPYVAEVSELAPVGTTVFEKIKALDIDAGVNGHCEYFTIPSNSTLENGMDGYGVFVIPQPHQGIVTVNRTLDYEKTQKYLLTVVASDRARDNKQRLSSTTTLTINVKDDDDQDPSFIYTGCSMYEGACINPEYTSSVNSGVLSGTLTIHPEKILAVDMDTLDAKIRYSIEAGEPDMWVKYFTIDSNSGAVRQLMAVDTSVTKKFMLTIKAEEQTESKRYALAILYITVKPVDTNPPIVVPTSEEGMVEENSPIGTKVVDLAGSPIRLMVTDSDLGPEDPIPNYRFELTSTSFAVDDQGYLIVNDENLDRDDPNTPDTGKFYRIQVVAREDNGAASPPSTLTITLIDLNDNSPVLPKSMRVNVPASLEPNDVYKVIATDLDSGENARITYTIKHVSNNGQTKFTVNRDTGVISTTGRLQSGEQYSITVGAEDGGGLKTQGIVELNVIPGPNTIPPQFTMKEYSAPVSEGAAINSTVITVIAKDPENDPVTYSIISGNDLRQFAIGSTSGIITVIRSLDREVLTRYQLMVKAEDSGKLFSTATVNIKVTDINDNNPQFEKETYIFSVKEGAMNEQVGYVHATDSDEGINAVVSYSLPENLPFDINNETGLITTKTMLDYETTKQYAFVVTATDGAIDKRLGTASVTVLVQDIPDEVPVFHTSLYTVHVPENLNKYPLVNVHAEDPDTTPEITYTIIRGDLNLFSIDRKSGMIRTVKPLDRETAARHEIVVGTEENSEENMPGATTTVEVLVDDKNDNEPIFTSISRPVTIDDASSIGTLVTTVIASDADATPPNNRVRYKLVGRGKASIYFHVEPDTGIVRVRDDLRKETDSEFTVDIQAYDQGDPVLNSVTSLTVYVSHSVTVPPDVRLGFADTVYTEHVAENAANGTLIRVLPLVNKRSHGSETPLKCKLTEFSHKGIFMVKLTEERDCAIYLNTSSLDYETLNEYSLEVHLESIEGHINPLASKATVKVHVTDANDNPPVFIYPDQSTIASAKGKYYAVVTKDMLLDTNVLQIKAKDKDSGDYGKIEYQKRTWPKVVEEYFTLDGDTGILSNVKTFENVPKEIPFKFSVTARDNPNSAQDYNTAKTNVVINLLQKENQLVLEVINLTPEMLRRRERSLLSVIEEKSGLIARVEKLTTRHYLGNNGTLETDSKGSDIWLYFIDPQTGEILTRDSKQVSEATKSGLHKQIATRLQSPVSEFRLPLAPVEIPRRPQMASAPLATALPAALLAMAALVLIAASVATVYICASWNRYKKHKEHEQQYGTITTMSAPARPNSGYDSSDEDPTSRYETQVLNMAVDDADLQLDFGPNNHAFNIHSVQYLSKDNGERSPTLSETATTARASSVNENGAVLNNSHFFDTNHSNANTRNTQTLNRRVQNNNHPLNNALGTLPRANNNSASGLLAATLGRKMNGNGHKKRTTQPIMAYDDIPGLQRASENDNVIFGKRNFNGFSYDQSPVETTTEL